MSDIKWINLNPFGSHRHKAKEKKCEDLEERTVGGKTISRPISMCPQCEVLHFSIVCTSCGYRNGPNDQESDDSNVSPKTMTIAQLSQDRLEDRHTHTPPRFQPDIFLETATIPIGYNGFPGDYSPRGTPRSTPQPTPTKRLSPLRPLRSSKSTNSRTCRILISKLTASRDRGRNLRRPEAPAATIFGEI